MNDFITVRDNIIRAALMMGARQIVLMVAGFLFGGFALSGDMVEAIAAGLVLTATVAYGQIRGWRDKRAAIALAERAPQAGVVK